MRASPKAGSACRQDLQRCQARGQIQRSAGSGRVERSSRLSQRRACQLESRHMPADGASEAHTTGRLGSPNSRQRRSASSCTQATPAGLPCGMPGMGELIEGAMQQAPQPVRQFMGQASGWTKSGRGCCVRRQDDGSGVGWIRVWGLSRQAAAGEQHLVQDCLHVFAMGFAGQLAVGIEGLAGTAQGEGLGRHPALQV